MEPDADLVEKANMGMDTPVAMVYWPAPVMGYTLLFVSMAIEGWSECLSPARVGTWTLGLTVVPRFLARPNGLG